MTTDITALPPERLGQLLRCARRHASLSRRRAANLASLTGAQLIAIERGWETPSQDAVRSLLSAYGTTVEQLMPQRIPLVVNGTQLGLAAVVGTSGPVHVAASSARDDLLRGYITLVTDARDNGSLNALTLRSSDVESLATALGTDHELLVERIAALLDCSLEEAASIGRLLRTFAGPILGVAFSVSVIGGSIVAGNTSGAHLLPASAQTPPVAVVAPEFATTSSAEADTAVSQALPEAHGTVGTTVNTSELAEAPSTPTTTDGSEGAQPTPTTVAMSTPGPSPSPSSTSTTPHNDAPDIGLLPGEAPSLIFEG